MWLHVHAMHMVIVPSTSSWVIKLLMNKLNYSQPQLSEPSIIQMFVVSTSSDKRGWTVACAWVQKDRWILHTCDSSCFVVWAAACDANQQSSPPTSLTKDTTLQEAISFFDTISSDLHWNGTGAACNNTHVIAPEDMGVSWEKGCRGMSSPVVL